MIQTAAVSVMTVILTRCGIECGYNTVTGMVLIIAGGISTALWGCLYQIKFGGKNIKRIVCDFFNIKAAPSACLLTAAFTGEHLLTGADRQQRPHKYRMQTDHHRSSCDDVRVQKKQKHPQ